MNKGSKIDVSGGSTLYESGIIHTSLLISKGKIFDISEADPNVVYDGFYTGSFVDRNLKFQMTSVYSIPLAKQGKRFVNSYQEGANGGKLSINAPAMALDGSLLGHTITGERQLDSPPKGSELSLSFTAIDTSYTNLPTFSPTPPKITFTQATNQAPANPFVLDCWKNEKRTF